MRFVFAFVSDDNHFSPVKAFKAHVEIAFSAGARVRSHFLRSRANVTSDFHIPRNSRNFQRSVFSGARFDDGSVCSFSMG